MGHRSASPVWVSFSPGAASLPSAEGDAQHAAGGFGADVLVEHGGNHQQREGQRSGATLVDLQGGDGDRRQQTREADHRQDATHYEEEPRYGQGDTPWSLRYPRRG